MGSGGAVASADADASAAGLAILRRGGNAVDAAVATAAALGVTEPYSAGIGGGGFMLVYEAARRRVHAIDGRETAPAAMRADAFRQAGGPIPVEEAASSGLSVGVPGTPATWQLAVARFGTMPLSRLLLPAIRIAERGFVVDRTYADQTADNAERFNRFSSTRRYYLTPGGGAPAPGALVRNRDLGRAYRLLGRRGVRAAFYRGPIGRAVIAAARRPPVVPGAPPVRVGLITKRDLVSYSALLRRPTRVGYRRHVVWGMPPPSSGGVAVGQALNILEGVPLRGLTRAQALHHLLEASALAFADRARYVADPAYTRVPLAGLLSEAYARARRACVDPARASAKPVPSGLPAAPVDGGCAPAAAPDAPAVEGGSTTHLTTADRWGNVVAYTLTIERIGGSGIAVPGWGFLLNNELTDFDPEPGSPNSPAGGKRPRSSMAPTIVTRAGAPALALGSPGGATIITTVLQVLVEHLELGRPLPAAVAAPRASQRNAGATGAEPAFLHADAPALSPCGHSFTEMPEIGAVTAVEILPRGRFRAVAEPVRRGGGSARVLRGGRTRAPGR